MKAHPSKRPVSCMPLVCGALLTIISACSAAPRDTEDPSMEYLKIQRSLATQGAVLEPGSNAERQAIEGFQKLLSDFKAPDFRQRIREVYAEDVFFNDTLKTVRGVDEVEEYLLASADAIDAGIVEFLDVVNNEGDYYFRWQMTLRFKRLARGEEKTSIGMSHIRFNADGKVVLHQDFWDSTSGLFEHMPILGAVLRRVKKRL